MSDPGAPGGERRGGTARERLAERLREGTARARAGAAAPAGPGRIPRRPAGSPAPLSFAQQRLWFLERLHPGTAGYHIARAFRVEGPLDVAALAGALAAIVRRHESLRTGFVAGPDGVPSQAVAARLRIALPVIDLSGLAALPAERREREVERLRRTEAERRFRLDRGPLMRAVLLRQRDDLHVLLATFHHAAADGWSMAVFYRELAALYAGEPLPEPPVQAADHAAWQRRRLTGPHLDALVAFWRRRLAGAPALIELPLDRPRPPERRFEGGLARAAVAVEPAALRAAGGASTTPFMVGLAAFAAVLERWGAGEDLVVGTPVAGRTEPELEGLIGFFVNTLALRLDLRGDPRFRELAARTRATALAAQEAQELPFERLVEELAPERTLTHPPLVQVVFSFDAAPPERLGLAGTATERLASRRVPAQFDLSLLLAEAGSGCEATLVYDADLFETATAERLLGHYSTLLAAAVAAPGLRLGELPLLDAAERRQVVVDWNRTEGGYPREATLDGLFAARAAAAPDAVALAWAGGALSYGALAAAAGRLAGELRRHGVGPEVRVGLLLERSPELIVAILAVVEAGGVYVPLDPGYPAERLAWMIADAAAPVVVASRATLARLPAGDGDPDRRPVLVIDEEPRAEAEPSGSGYAPPKAACAAGGGSAAYVLYTSGSTGRPKGVAVTHRNVVRLVLGEEGPIRFGPGEVFLQYAPAAFDASTLEIWAPLVHGGRLALMPPGRASLGELTAAVERFGVTALWLTAGLFHQVVEERLADLARPGSPLRQLLSGGDVLSPRHVERLLAARPELTLINGYGPTENTTFTACHPMRGAAAGIGTEPFGTAALGTVLFGTVPIGRPIPGTRVYLLDRGLQPVPVGVAGQLHAGGDGVARGYLGRPGLTAERFVPDPFAGEPGAGPAGGRLYRTGDRARWRAGGTLEFLGRLDRQVKIRGYRVEPGEVEAVLGRHREVAACAVTVRDDGPGGGRCLVAYAVGRGRPADPAALRSYLREALPEPMVPACDRRRRGDPARPQRQARPPRAAGARLERRRRRGGRGGRAGAAADAARGAGGRGLGRGAAAAPARSAATRTSSISAATRFWPPRWWRAWSAPARWRCRCAICSRRRRWRGWRSGSARRSPAAAARRRRSCRCAAVERLLPLPLSFAQERLWFLDRLEPGAPPTTSRWRSHLDGPASPPALAAALDALRRRHGRSPPSSSRTRGGRAR